jgi:D-alanine-D-alanine ligase-like ATP-grasp enzyme
MPTDSGKEIFTVKLIEEVGLRHTGPSSDALAIGLDKEATKNVFRKLGLPTPVIKKRPRTSSVSSACQPQSQLW